MSEHTPGPWHWHRGPGPNIYAEDGTEIGQINFSVDGELIAAAPDLLAACEALASGRNNDAFDLARAALAKARGK
jgi:hypothetical protein